MLYLRLYLSSRNIYTCVHACVNIARTCALIVVYTQRGEFFQITADHITELTLAGSGRASFILSNTELQLASQKGLRVPQHAALEPLAPCLLPITGVQGK